MTYMSESFATQVALMTSTLVVRLQMVRQVARLREFLITEGTVVGLLAVMESEVVYKVTRLGEGFPTMCALVRTNSCRRPRQI